MSQKLIIGTLAILIIGVIGSSIYFALPDNTVEATEIVSDAQVTTENVQATGQNAQAQGQSVAVQSDITREPQVMAEDNVGDVWDGEGTIILLEDFGFTLQLSETETVYVELGPPDYWQSQGVALADGDSVQVNGWNNSEQIHARIVTTANGELVLRSETSQPLWAGGANSGQSQTGSADGTQTGQVEFQVAPEDWVTVNGVVGIVTNGTITMEATDGTAYSLQMGQPNFWQSQGVILSVGDEIEVLGFWMNDQFMVGDITKTATGEHIILRDPNGRQLWGGPGRNGASGNNGSGNSNENGSSNGNRYRNGQTSQ